jgi:hypothetical protein
MAVWNERAQMTVSPCARPPAVPGDRLRDVQVAREELPQLHRHDASAATRADAGVTGSRAFYLP